MDAGGARALAGERRKGEGGKGGRGKGGKEREAEAGAKAGRGEKGVEGEGGIKYDGRPCPGLSSSFCSLSDFAERGTRPAPIQRLASSVPESDSQSTVS